MNAECSYKQPLRFEDEVEVDLLVREKRRKAITYEFIFRKLTDGERTEVARGIDHGGLCHGGSGYQADEGGRDPRGHRVERSSRRRRRCWVMLEVQFMLDRSDYAEY